MRLTKAPPSKTFPIVPPKDFLDYIALIFTTGFFTGYAPIAPGTFGSALAAALYYGVIKSNSSIHLDSEFFIFFTLICVAVSYFGIWSSSRAEKFFGCKDPGQATADEVAGQLITYLFLPIVPEIMKMKWGFESWTILGFLLFRILDITKPYPVRDLEKLQGGLGIMADDILAGIQGAILMMVAAYIMVHFIL